MKKLLALIIAVIMIFSLVGCGGSTESNPSSSDIGSSDTSSNAAQSDISSTNESAPESLPTSSTVSSAPVQTTTYSRDLLVDYRFSDNGNFNVAFAMSFAVKHLTANDDYVIEQDHEEGMWKAYCIPEAAVRTALEKDFVVSDAFWNEIKNVKEEYYLNQADTCYYAEEGSFMVMVYDYWKEVTFATYEYIKHIDHKNGTVSVYLNYAYDIEDTIIEIVFTHNSSGSVNVTENGYSGAKITSTSKSLIDSIRMKSIRSVDSLPN